MKVVICGAGQVGTSIARHLAGENNDVTVLDQSPELIQKLSDTLDVRAIAGFASYPSVLEQAGLRDADMLIGDFINDHISLVTGDGTGQLSETATLVVDGPAPSGLFSADLNADGWADIVYAAQQGGFSVAMGIGGGAFDPPTSVDIGSNEFGLEGADFNGDGRMDFAVINISSNDLVIMLGD